MSKLPEFVSNNQPEFGRFFKFAIVGAVGAVVDFSILNLLILVFGWPKFFANLVSVTGAVISNFTWNRRWTFPESRDHAIHLSFSKFAVVNLIGLAINQTVFVAADMLIFEPMFGPRSLSYNLSKACAIAVVLFWNFGANRLWTYRGI